MTGDRADGGPPPVSAPVGIYRGDESPELAFRGKLIRLGILNNVAAVVRAVTGFVMVPIMLVGLGSASYGTWIMIISVNGLIMSMDFGLNVVVNREVSRTRARQGPDAAVTAQAAGGALMLLGVVGALVLVGIGVVAEHLSLFETRTGTTTMVVFALVGVALLAEQVIQYTIAVLSAHLRFGSGNLILSAGTILRAGLLAGALILGTGLIGVAAAHAAGTALTALIAALFVQRVDSRYGLAALTLDWHALRPQLEFGLSSLLATMGGTVLWQIHPLMIGTLVGPAAVAAFHVGIRLPMQASEMNWRTAEVLFPAVAAATAEEGESRDPGMALSTGARWLTLLVVPLAVMGFTLAPAILDAWLVDVPEGAVAILRVGVVVMLLDAWAVVALQVIWGLGKARYIALAMGGAAITAVGLNSVLLPSVGALAAPVAMGAGLTLLAGLVYAEAVRSTGVGLWGLVRRDMVSVLPAGAACAAGAALGGRALVHSGSLPVVAGGALLGLVAYAAAVRFTPTVADERLILRRVLARLMEVIRDLAGALRARAKNVRVLRSGWYLIRILSRRLRNRLGARPERFDRLFRASPDPWRYGSEAEAGRHDIAEGLVESISDARATDRVVEIGCAEGTFTERLQRHARSLLALDISEVALENARQRRPWKGTVQFSQFDVVRDDLPGRYSLVVVMDVLTYVESRATMRRVRQKIIDATDPGGWVLVGDVRQSDVFETSWWGKALLCGGLRICEFMGAHPEVTVQGRAQTETHVFRLLRKGI